MSAEAFHAAAQAALAAAGFDAQREVRIPDRGDGMAGRLDLVLDGWFAVELDRVTPREKSLRKVEAFGAGIVYCRCPRGAGRGKKVWEGTIPSGLDTPDFQEAWKAYLTHREEIKKPLTPRAGDMLLRKLAGWGARRAVAAIQHSIAQSWQGIFEPEDTPLRHGSKINGHAGEDRGMSELAEIRRRMAERGFHAD